MEEGIKAVAAFVRERRKMEGLTQRRLAELAGVGNRVVVELEHAKPTLRMDVVERVLRVFGCTVRVSRASRAEGGGA